jgi:hypothetical protein
MTIRILAIVVLSFVLFYRVSHRRINSRRTWTDNRGKGSETEYIACEPTAANVTCGVSYQISPDFKGQTLMPIVKSPLAIFPNAGRSGPTAADCRHAIPAGDLRVKCQLGLYGGFPSIGTCKMICENRVPLPRSKICEAKEINKERCHGRIPVHSSKLNWENSDGHIWIADMFAGRFLVWHATSDVERNRDTISAGQNEDHLVSESRWFWRFIPSNTYSHASFFSAHEAMKSAEEYSLYEFVSWAPKVPWSGPIYDAHLPPFLPRYNPSTGMMEYHRY